MHQIGDDQTNRITLTGGKHARQHVGSVVQLSYALKDALSSCSSHVRFVTQDLGDSYKRNSKIWRCPSVELPFVPSFSAKMTVANDQSIIVKA